MNMMTRSLLLVAALGAACTSNTATTRDDAMSAAESQPATVVTPAQANTIFAEGFDAADPDRALAHLDDDVVWFLTNGAPVRGKAAVAGFVTKGRSGGAGDFDFSNPREIAAGQFTYVIDDFAFDLNADKRVEGTRYALWSMDGDANLLVDAWMPAGPHDDALASELAGASQAMADAINGDDAQAIAATYTQDAVVVLSNGTTHLGDSLGAFFTSIAEMDIEDMRVGAPSRAVRVGDDTAYAVTSWAFTAKTPNGNIPLGGERVMVWKKGDDGTWRAAMELSWPNKK